MNASLRTAAYAMGLALAIGWVHGAFLAVPITACMAMVFAEFPATRPIAVLLSRDGRLEPAP